MAPGLIYVRNETVENLYSTFRAQFYRLSLSRMQMLSFSSLEF